MDADTDKKIWQGWTTERLNGAGITDLNVKKVFETFLKNQEILLHKLLKFELITSKK